MILSLEGEPKTGKSTFGYSAPLPIVAFSFDQGHDRALHGVMHDKLLKGLSIKVHKAKTGDALPEPAGDVTVYSVLPPMQMDPSKTTGMMTFWKWLLPYLQAQILVPGTLIVDTMTLLREHRIAAHLEDTGQRALLQIQYGIPNESIRALFTNCQSYEKDLIAVHHLRAKWGKVMKDGKVVDAELPGEFEAAGLSDTDKLVDVVLRMERAGAGDGAMMKGSIQLCGYNPGLEGMVLMDPVWDKLVDRISNMGWSGEAFNRRGTLSNVGK